MLNSRGAAGLVALGFLLVGCAGGEVAESTKEDATPAALIARAELFGNPEKAGVNISPDGKQISYLAPVDGVLNVWVGPVDDPAAAKPVTDDTGRGIRRYFWAFSNKHIVYLQDIGGDENWRAYSSNLETGEIKDLTPFDEVQVRIQQVSHKMPDEILVAINNRNPQLHDIHLLNIDTGEMKMIEENPGYVGYVSDDEYNVRLGMHMTPGGGMRFDKKSQIGEWKEWMAVDKSDTLTTQPVGFDKTGEVVYMIDSRDRNTAALVAHDLRNDERTIIHENSRADVDNAIVHPTEYTVQAASSTYTRREWEILDDGIKKDIDYLNTVAEGELDVIDRTLDDSQWIVGYEMADEPYKYYRYDREAQKADFLFTSRPDLEDEKMAQMHPVVIPARDGLELVSYLTLPTHTDSDGDGRPDEPLSMVLFVHGGPSWARTSSTPPTWSGPARCTTT
jgi:dipeptidyl aminopeptidase/acylaminoacyl peptidase